MKKTAFNTGLLYCLSALSIVWMTPALSYDFVSEHCNSGVKCITLTLHAKAMDGDENVKYNIKRIKVTNQADHCTVMLNNGGTKIISTKDVAFAVNNGKTSLKRTWRIPAGCPYKLQARKKMPWYKFHRPYRFYHSIDAVTSLSDYCIERDFYQEITSDCS